MKYEVIKTFIDSQDKNKKYRVGDFFPTPANKKISTDRLATLLSANNKLKQPVIREIEEKQDV